MTQTTMYTQEQLDIALLKQDQGQFNQALVRIESKLSQMDNKIGHNFYILLTICLSGYASLFAIMTKVFHWI